MLVVAHRAGNDLELLRRAEALGVWLVEADVHLFRGRLEVRHLKTAGPVPILWDRWTLAPPWTPRLLVDALLAAAAPETGLMLDLKGRHHRLPARLADELADAGRAHGITVCSRSWALLEPLAGHDGVRVVHSVGSRRQLAALRRRFAGARLGGISIHRRLLTAEIVADLRTLTDVLMTWPIADAADARRLEDWGVTAVITERYEELAPALAVAAVH